MAFESGFPSVDGTGDPHGLPAFQKACSARFRVVAGTAPVPRKIQAGRIRPFPAGRGAAGFDEGGNLKRRKDE